MRYIQHKLLALSNLLHLSQQHLIITITPTFTWTAITPIDFYFAETYNDLVDKINQGIRDTMAENNISDVDLYEEMKKIDMPKEPGRWY